MFDIKTLGKQASIALCALMFGSTMILSAAGPLRADAPSAQQNDSSAPATLRYTA